MSSDPLEVMFSFGAVQGMLDPMTPLGQDAMKIIFAIGSSLMRIQVTAETQRVLYTAGERFVGAFYSPHAEYRRPEDTKNCFPVC